MSLFEGNLCSLQPRASTVNRDVNTSPHGNAKHAEYVDSIVSNFQWLKYALWWSLLWVTRTESGRPRSVLVNVMGIALTTIQMMVYPVLTYQDYKARNSMDMLFDCTSLIALLASRLLSFYYFLRHFDYPWQHIFDHHNHCMDLISYNYYWSKSWKVSLWLLAFVVASFLLLSIHNLLYEFGDDRAPWIRALDIASSVFGTFLPNILTHTIITILFLKYRFFLHSMQYMVEQVEPAVNFKQIKDEYKRMHRLFVDEYRRWQYFIGLYLLAFLYNIWLFLDEMRNRDELFTLMYFVSGIVFYILPSLQFITGATSLNDEYQRLVDSLNDFEPPTSNRYFENVDYDNAQYQRSMISVYSDQNSSKHLDFVPLNSSNTFQSLWNRQDLLFLLQYIENYPIEARLFGMKVTKMNSLKFIISFIVAKLVSYSIYYRIG